MDHEELARLRRSKEDGGSQDYHDGYEDGMEWACENAKWKDLIRLSDALEDCIPNQGALPLYASFAQTVDPDATNMDYWAELIGNRAGSDAYMTGFWDGAVSLYLQYLREF